MFTYVRFTPDHTTFNEFRAVSVIQNSNMTLTFFQLSVQKAAPCENL